MLYILTYSNLVLGASEDRNKIFKLALEHMKEECGDDNKDMIRQLVRFYNRRDWWHMKEYMRNYRRKYCGLGEYEITKVKMDDFKIYDHLENIDD